MSTWGQKIGPLGAIVPTERVLPHPKKEKEQEENSYSISSTKSHSFDRNPTFSNLKLLITDTTFLGAEPVPEVFY